MDSITRRIVASVAALGLAAVRGAGGADQVTLLSVQSGHSVVLKAEGLTRVAVGDGRIAGVVPVGTSQVVVNGKAPGHTTIFVWAGGRRVTYEVTVTEQALDDVAQMLRSAIKAPGVEVVTLRPLDRRPRDASPTARSSSRSPISLAASTRSWSSSRAAVSSTP